MENEKLNEKISINDEILEDVSAGAGILSEGYCPLCRRNVVKYLMVKYGSNYICKDCYNKLTNK